MSDAKNHLRQQIRADRAAARDADRARVARGLATAGPLVARWVHRGLAAFQPTNAEPDISGLVAAIDAPVFVPRVAGERLEWVAVGAEWITVAHRTGIPDPPGDVVAIGARIAELVDVILVPALAVDPATGARLGYGAGFYDRLLAGMPAHVLTIGVCRDTDLLRVPGEPHDVPLAAVLTESGLRRRPPAATA
ncbi:MAG: 5-formyltetrahydrofolate cyclo-ligase [Candidatus Nanopelagicales bacterium]